MTFPQKQRCTTVNRVVLSLPGFLILLNESCAINTQRHSLSDAEKKKVADDQDVATATDPAHEAEVIHVRKNRSV